MLEKELPGQGKTSDLKCERQLLEEAGARLDVQLCSLCPLGQTGKSPEHVWLRRQPKAKKVSPSVLRQVDIEGEMPK